ncbi:hypothetical protein V502_00856 [Pseudogymnoascus sp. VKM F-4520 (FW-2644)]|nr:hypothetical protein V502_00856 [Pseudogymnoascus sp. VKM F-4520 (FW-2644)]
MLDDKRKKTLDELESLMAGLSQGWAGRDQGDDGEEEEADNCLCAAVYGEKYRMIAESSSEATLQKDFGCLLPSGSLNTAQELDRAWKMLQKKSSRMDEKLDSMQWTWKVFQAEQIPIMFSDYVMLFLPFQKTGEDSINSPLYIPGRTIRILADNHNDVNPESEGLLTLAADSSIKSSSKVLSIYVGNVPRGILKPTQDLICAHGIGNIIMDPAEQSPPLQESDYSLRDAEGRIRPHTTHDDGKPCLGLQRTRGSRITMDWMSELNAELRQAEQRKNGLEQFLAFYKAQSSISIKEYDSYVADYNARIAALKKEKAATRKSMEEKISSLARIAALEKEKAATRKSMEEKISSLARLDNDCYMELQTVKRRIEFTKELQQNQNRMDLLKLPPKILETILGLLLVEDRPIYVSSTRGCEQMRNLAVFYTCRQIKAEAYDIFYRRNVFQVDPKFEITPGTSFIKFSAYLKHIEVRVDDRTNVSNLLRDIERSKKLQTLLIEILDVPTYRNSQQPSTLGSLKFQRPSSLRNIEVLCSATMVTAELKDARSIIHAVLEKGSYESPDQGVRHSGGERSSARVKRQKLSYGYS